ncbi:lipase, partial [Dietzia sp. SLG510A3-40A3]|nr:lipase [Dietzia sp. SLG510A3-40A3]
MAGLVAAALLVVVAPVASAAPNTAPNPAPTADQVPWRWWDGAAHQLTHGLGDPPGLNRDD